MRTRKHQSLFDQLQTDEERLFSIKHLLKKPHITTKFACNSFVCSTDVISKIQNVTLLKETSINPHCAMFLSANSLIIVSACYI